jgi:hypothetical protein
VKIVLEVVHRNYKTIVGKYLENARAQGAVVKYTKEEILFSDRTVFFMRRENFLTCARFACDEIRFVNFDPTNTELQWATSRVKQGGRVIVQAEQVWPV